MSLFEQLAFTLLCSDTGKTCRPFSMQNAPFVCLATRQVLNIICVQVSLAQTLIYILHPWPFLQMTMYDTAGIERHMSTIPQTYFRWSKVIMLVYSIDDSDTFDSLTNWADNAISARAGRAQSDVITVLVGNKLDLDDDRKVSKARAQQYAENNDIDQDMVFEVSVKDGTGVQEMLDKIALKIKPDTRSNKPKERTGKNKCC